MRRLAAVAIPAAILIAPTWILDAAPASYSPQLAPLVIPLYGDAPYRVTAASVSAFESAFSSYSLYVVETLTRLPPVRHYMAVSSDETLAFDLTNDWNELMAHATKVVLTAQDAVAVGKALAATQAGEVLPARVVVNSGWSSDLGVDLSDPRAEPILSGWRVTLSTWSPEDGGVVDWSIDFQTTRVADSASEVRALGKGLSSASWEVPNLRSGDSLRVSYATDPPTLSGSRANATGAAIPLRIGAAVETSACPTFAQRLAFDGTVWKACYPDVHGVPPNVLTVGADALDSAVKAYDAMVGLNAAPCANVPNPDAAAMGFRITDDDCQLMVVILADGDLFCEGCYVARPPCAPTPCAGPERIYLDPFVRESVRLKHAYADPLLHDDQAIMDLIMAHETFHVVQAKVLGENGIGYSQAFLEGSARWIETFLEPRVTMHPTSLYFHPGPDASAAPSGLLAASAKSVLMKSAQGYQKYPTTGFCDLGYATAPFWGTVHRDHGPSAIRKIFEKTAEHPYDTSCYDLMVDALPHAVGATESGVLFQSLADAAAASVARDFQWPDRSRIQFQWGSHLTPATTQTTMLPGVDRTLNVAGRWGHEYAPIGGGLVTVSCETSGGAASHLLNLSGGAVTRDPIPCDGRPIPIDTSLHDRVVLMVQSEKAAEEPASAVVRVRAQP